MIGEAAVVFRIAPLPPALEAIVRARLHEWAGLTEKNGEVLFNCAKCRRLLSPVEWTEPCAGARPAAEDPMSEEVARDPIARGPWTLDEVGMIIRDADGEHVAAVAATRRRTGLVLTAALDMLEALEVAVDTIRQWHDHGVDAKERGRVWDLYQASPEMQAINAAIAKARGTAAPATPSPGPMYDLDGLGDDAARA